jgi:hypothetical protein
MYLARTGETPPSHILNASDIQSNYKSFGSEASLLGKKDLRRF